jgi:hypothetical protein
MLTCPRRPILDDPKFYNDVFGKYRAYQKGHLYDEGSLGSQPTLLLECFYIVDQTLDVVEDFRREQDAKKRKR